jgi:hypothetical protein
MTIDSQTFCKLLLKIKSSSSSDYLEMKFPLFDNIKWVKIVFMAIIPYMSHPVHRILKCVIQNKQLDKFNLKFMHRKFGASVFRFLKWISAFSDNELQNN